MPVNQTVSWSINSATKKVQSVCDMIVMIVMIYDVNERKTNSLNVYIPKY